MAYKKYKLSLFIRVTILFISLASLAFVITHLNFNDNLPVAIVSTLPLVLISFLSLRNLIRFLIKRFDEMDDFFESVKYRDFSRWFAEKSGSEDIRELHRGFNLVNKTIKKINTEKEEHHLYLQKILALVDTGIVAYNTDSGSILWINDSFKKILDIPSLKNIDFIKTRNLDLFEAIFLTNHASENTISIDVANNKTKIMISSSLFLIKDASFKLIVIQNIDDTINRTESEAWKKLLSVMTHEIMNSIAPISSLAETLQSKIHLTMEDPKKHILEITDLDTGIESIKNRSEGLLKFAKTYRSLNKITKLNLSKILVLDLFENIKILMLPSLENKNIEFNIKIDNPDLLVEIDRYLMEQVLINLILNAVEACKDREKAMITLSAQKNIEGKSIIKIFDNGKGIPEEIIDDVFIPFFSTKKSGSGIGLSLCKQIILLHNGRISIRSTEGKGTIISLIF